MTAQTLGHKSDNGFCGILSFEFKPDPANSPELELVTRGSWQRFSTDEANDYTIKAVELDIKLNYALHRSPNMYLIGGGGFAEVEFNRKETSPIASVGVGLELGSFSIEARAARVFGDHYKETTYFPVTLGLRL